MSRLSILVIEGDRTLATLFGDIFELQNWDADSCCNAEESITVLQGAKKYDVILTSYRVPGTNGLELVKLIRTLEHRNGTPVIVVTGSSGIEPDALAAGASEVVRKPVDMTGLVEAVRRQIAMGAMQIHPLPCSEPLAK